MQAEQVSFLLCFVVLISPQISSGGLKSMGHIFTTVSFSRVELTLDWFLFSTPIDSLPAPALHPST